MSRHINWWTVAAASTLFVSGTSQADLLGLDAQLVDVDHITGMNAPADPHYTIDIFAIMEAGDRLDAVAGDATTQKMISTVPEGQFWQDAVGGNSSININPALFGTFPSLPYDSFITIGLLDSTDNALTIQGIDFSDFETGGSVVSNNGAWFVTPDDVQGESDLYAFGCGDEYAVRIARLTVLGHASNVHFEGLLQGKDAGGATITLSTSLDVTLSDLQFDDCNSNGVDDSCDIANGTSLDTDENGIPDECQSYDCNENGIDDGDDIADGTSEDCNSNGVPDECDIADGTSNDCDENGTPDECQGNDCNGNGVPDNCDISDGTSEDCDEDGTPDECELDSDGDGTIDDCEVPPNYENFSQGTTYEFFYELMADAHNGDMVGGLASAMNTEGVLDFESKCVQFSTDTTDETLDIYDPVYLSGCGSFNAGVNPFFNSLYSGSFGTSRFDYEGTAAVEHVTVRSGATLEIANPLPLGGGDFNVNSSAIIRNDGTLSALNGLEVGEWGIMSMHSTATIEADIFNNGQYNAQGLVLGSISNNLTMNAIGEMTQVGSLNNFGTINIYRGVYTLVGDLTNNGTIIGDIDSDPGRSETQPGDGLNISGNFSAGAGTSLVMPHEYWAIRVGGNIGIAINDAGNFNMSVAELNATGRTGSVQDIEVMGSDLGNGTDGLEQGVAGNYPLGTLRIDAISTSNLVDNYDNDNMKQADGEAIYCNVLIVDGHLETNGYKVYANEIIINGSVSNNDDVIIIVDGIFGDINADGEVNVLDLLRVIADWGQPGGDADLNEDGIVDILDFLLVLQEWS